MSKVWRAILLSAYGVLFIQYLRITLDRSKDEIDLEYIMRPPGSFRKLIRNIKKNKNNFTRMNISFKKPDRLPTDLKYILEWTTVFTHYSSSIFKSGQTLFLEKNCTYVNCFMTNDKRLLVDLRLFDAIIFNVENTWDKPPIIRAPHQKYIFTAAESSRNYLYCHPLYDSYYNLTWSYKLDSDIIWPYFVIEDKKGNLVGPKIDLKWINPMQPTSKDVANKLIHKRKAAAWFVSHCNAKSGREIVARELRTELVKYNLKLDTYGKCGELMCPKDRMEECLELLEQDYYFYFAFENSLTEDYVTEKLLSSLLHMTVPVVYGGANYSRFLPPGSYINAGELNATEVAFLMNRAIKNPVEYRNYFRWHNHYIYKEKKANDDACTLCQILNDPAKEYTVVKDFRKWWTPNFEDQCKDYIKNNTYNSTQADNSNDNAGVEIGGGDWMQLPSP